MGAFYNSICIPGDEHQRVRQSLGRWLGLRGFEPVDEPMLFDLDGETERCAFLLWNAHWTVVVFSKYEEERRLLRELQTWQDTLLYVWVQDSEVWGYDLLDGGGFVGSFSSDPGYYLSFDDTALGSPQRPEADVSEVCRRLDRPELEDPLRRLQRRSARFEEELCAELCRLLGVDAAMASYDDLEGDRIQGLDGWQSQRLFFRQRQSAPGEGVSLHGLSLDAATSGATWMGSRSPSSLMPDLHEEMEQVRRRTRARWVILRPIVRLARWWRRWQGSSPSFHEAPPSGVDSSTHGSSVYADRRLVNTRHGCRILLAIGANAEEVSGKPSSVFKFRVGETLVTCTSRSQEKLPDVLRRPSRSEVVRDEKYSANGLQARYVLFKLPPLYLAGTRDTSYLGLHVVQTPLALYVFLYRSLTEPSAAVELAIRSTVESFELL